jgi:hypothetical protein
VLSKRDVPSRHRRNVPVIVDLLREFMYDGDCMWLRSDDCIMNPGRSGVIKLVMMLFELDSCFME